MLELEEGENYDLITLDLHRPQPKLIQKEWHLKPKVNNSSLDH